MKRIMKFTQILITLLYVSVAFGEVSICSRSVCPEAKCHSVKDPFDCLEEINREKKIVGSFKPDLVLLASRFYPDIKVFAKLSIVERITSNWQNEIVIVTNHEVTKMHELKNYSYYHIGLENLNLKRYILNKFEDMILENITTNSCGKTPTLAERNICFLEEFFGPSCRQGSWVDYDEQKFAFTREYPKLTELCNNSASFEVLNNPEGVVIATTAKLIKTATGVNFSYLWNHFETSDEVYSWYSQPWPLALTHNNDFNDVRDELKKWFAYCQSFIGMLNDAEYSSNPVASSSIFKPKCDNSTGFFLWPYERLSFKTEEGDLPRWEMKEYDVSPLRWCTISKDETRKCEWLKLVAGNLAYPIDCVQNNTKVIRCLKAIEDEFADIIAVEDTPGLTNLKEIATVEDCDTEFCGEGAKVLSRYKVLMRKDDPNRANAKVLLESLRKFFLVAEEDRLFDLFGDFKGIPNLLFPSYATNMTKFTVHEDVAELSDISTTFTPSSTSTDKPNGASSINVISCICIISIIVLKF